MDSNILRAANELVVIRNEKIFEMKTAIDDMIQNVLNRKIELLNSFRIDSDSNNSTIWKPIRFYISFPIAKTDFPSEVIEYAKTYYFLQTDYSVTGITGFEKIIKLEELDDYIKALNP